MEKSIENTVFSTLLYLLDHNIYTVPPNNPQNHTFFYTLATFNLNQPHKILNFPMFQAFTIKFLEHYRTMQSFYISIPIYHINTHNPAHTQYKQSVCLSVAIS